MTNLRCVVNHVTRLKALSAELKAAERLTQSLEGQRDALIAQDADRLDEVTASLQDQFEQFRYLVQRREAAFGDMSPPTGEELDLLSRLRAADYRAKTLAELNQEILADRLAYLRAMLALLRPKEQAAGYGPAGQANGASNSSPRPRIERSA